MRLERQRLITTSSLDKVIIKACLNGSRRRDDNPNIPWTPEEVAEEAYRCYEAGAAIVHFHARDEDGGLIYNPDWYIRADDLIRSRCDVVLNHTTAREPGVPVEHVTRYLLETPDPVEMVSVNLGYGVQWMEKGDGGWETRVTPNSFDDIAATLEACYSRGTFPEPGVHDLGMLNNAVTLLRAGLLKDSSYFLVEFEANWGNGRQAMPGTPRHYYTLCESIQELYPKATLMVHGAGADTFTIVSLGIATGAHVRVGFEDSLSLPGIPHPVSNAEFVEWAVRLARLHGREPCSPGETRQKLGLLPFPARAG